MKTTFITKGLWPQLTRVARGSRQACSAAVAYFGAGASRLLPLPKGSRLVVDASERAVASGQTCPADLIKLSRRGVAIYSVPNLHAKVFVLGKTAYIGSANVSRHSATALIEAVVYTTEPLVVRAARDFVQDKCLHELSLTVLKRLAKLYHPPKIHGRKRGAKPVVDTSERPTLPRLFTAHIYYEAWTAREQAQHDAGETVAKKRRKHPRTFKFDSFQCTGKCQLRRRDLVLQVANEGGGKYMVKPPAEVLYVRRYSKPKRVAYVYMEMPRHNQVNLKRFAKAISRGAKGQLSHEGFVRKAGFAQEFLKYWANR